MYLISVCIPTYNGAKTLRETLDSILSGLDESKIEIVISDDCSTDNTFEIARSYADKHPNIVAFQGKVNSGMDRNFTNSALYATGKYVWFCGQDDIFRPGAIEKALKIIEDHPDIDMIHFNHTYMSEDLESAIYQKFHLQEDQLFEGTQEFFDTILLTPAFLPSVIMRQNFWKTTDYELYYDTYYVQSGVWLENSEKSKMYVVADPSLIYGKMPLDSWKYVGGSMIFGTALGFFKVHKIAYLRKKISRNVFIRMKQKYLKEYLFTIIAGKAKGLLMSDNIKNDLDFCLKEDKILYYLYILPLWYMPKVIAKAIYFIRRTTRVK